MSLTGSSKKAPASPGVPTIRLKDLHDQLDSEWVSLKQDSVDQHGADEVGLLAYYHACVRPALHWVGGDPYSFEFPESYQPERLAKLCGYLKTLQAAEPGQVKAARERNLVGLRAVWPSYAALIGPEKYPDDYCLIEAEVPPFSWDAIETAWNGDGPDDYRTNFLPTFATRESADFHLAALAVLFLNRQLRYALTDLYPHQESN